MVTAALIINSPKVETARYPAVCEWLNKFWYIYTMRCYSTIERNELLIHATT